MRIASSRLRRAAGSSLHRREGSQCPEGEHGPGPRPDVLRREVATGGLAQVVVDVVGGDVVDRAVVVDVLEELLAGQLLAAADDRARDDDRGGRLSC